MFKKKNFKKKSKRIMSDSEILNFKNYILLATDKNNFLKYLPLLNIEFNNISLFKSFLKEVFYCTIKEFFFLKSINDAIEFYNVIKSENNYCNVQIEKMIKIKNNICYKCNEKFIKLICLHFSKVFNHLLFPNKNNYYIIYNCKFEEFQPTNVFKSIFFRRLITNEYFTKNEIDLNILFVLFKSNIQNIKKYSEIQENKIKKRKCIRL